MTTSAELSGLFDLIRGGNVAARNALLTATRDELTLRVARRLREFRVVTRESEAEDVMNDLVVRLIRALDAGVRVTTADGFIGFAVNHLERLLIDKAQKLRRRDGLAPTFPLDGDDPDSAGCGRAADPSVAAEENEFRRRVGTLPADERQVVEMHLLEEWRQSEVAAALGNYSILSRGTATTALVALRVDKKPGEPLQEADFEPVPVRGDAPLFAGTLAYDDRAAVYGKALRRKVARGELLLRADVEADPAAFDPPPPGYATLTLPARLTAVACRPAPGEYVELFVRPATGPADGPGVRHGPFRFLGWAADPSRANHDGQLIHVVVAVPHTAADPREAGLRALQAGGSHDRLIQVEVVRGATKAP